MVSRRCHMSRYEEAHRVVREQDAHRSSLIGHDSSSIVGQLLPPQRVVVMLREPVRLVAHVLQQPQRIDRTAGTGDGNILALDLEQWTSPLLVAPGSGTLEDNLNRIYISSSPNHKGKPEHHRLLT